MTPRICHVFPTFGPGGSQARTRLLIDSLGSAWTHTVIALDGDLRSAAPLADTPRFRTLAPDLGRIPQPALVRLLRSEKPSLVATYNWGAMDAVMAARFLGLPVLHHEDGFNPDEMYGQKRRRVWARRLLLRGTEGVVVPSLELERLAAASWQLPPSSIVHVANGIDTERFRPGPSDSVRKLLGLGARDLLVGTVGRLNAVKNVGKLIRAVAAANNELPVSLVILGEGEELERLIDLSASLHISPRVHFIGHVADPAPWYGAMDVFAMSSRTEQMPIAVLEAMATGLPIVATAVGDTAAMVAEPNRALIASESDAQAYQQALLSTLTSGPLRFSLGRANRARAIEVYDQSRMIECHHELWSRALEGSGALRRRGGSRRAAA